MPAERTAPHDTSLTETPLAFPSDYFLGSMMFNLVVAEGVFAATLLVLLARRGRTSRGTSSRWGRPC
ncbi:MAG: hypothetical protein ABR599_05475 [Gemmatimonadota bacterium]